MEPTRAKQSNSKSWRIYLYGHLIVLTVIFIVFVSIFMARYVYKTETKIAADDQQSFVNIIESYAETMAEIFTTSGNVSTVVSGLVQKGDPAPVDHMWAASRLERVVGVYVVNEAGVGIDESGEAIVIPYTDLLKNLDFDTVNGKPIFMRNPAPSVDEGESLLAVSSVKGEDGQVYYCITEAKDKSFSETFSIKEFDGLTVYLIVNSDGDVLYTAGGKSNLAKNVNIWNIVDKNAVENADIKDGIEKSKTGIGRWNYKGESKELIVTPIGKTNINLVAGINESYIESKIKMDTKDTDDLKKVMTAAILIYICALAITLASYNTRFIKNHKQLEEKADTDLLTGINNKLATERKIKEFLAENPDVPCMVMIFDIDNFKKINDTKGHAFGDDVIREVGQAITGQFRVTDIIGRIGGDEFMIFLKNIPSDEIAIREAKKLMWFFKDFVVGGYVKYSPTASVGVAMVPSDGTDFETIYKAADKALYRSKQNGRNQLNFFNEDIETIKA